MKKFFVYPILAVVALFVVACSDSVDSPEGITKHFIESTYKGDSTALIDSLDLGEEDNNPEVKQMITGKMAMAAAEAKKQSELNGGVASIDIKNINYKNSEKTQANVSFVVKFKKDGLEDVGDLDTIKTDKGWKVSL